MTDEESTTAQICAYWNALVLSQDASQIPLEADLAATIHRLRDLNVIVPAGARDRVREEIQVAIVRHRQGGASMSSPASLAIPPSLAAPMPPRLPLTSIAPYAFGRGQIATFAAMLVLVLILGAVSLPFLTPRLGGPPQSPSILPALTLPHQDTPAVQEITGGDDPMDVASGVAVGTDGTLYVIDVKGDQIRVFDAAGKPTATWGTSGDGPGEFGFSFDYAWGDLAFAPDGNLYILDPNLARVQKFTPEGAFLHEFGERGSEDGQLLFPTGIGVGPDGNVYVADYQNHRVQVFTGDGAFLAAWDGAEADGPPLAGPSDVAVGPDGTVWVTDDILQKIIAFAPDGAIVATFGKIGDKPGEVRGPGGIAVDAEGRIYVADVGNDRVQQFAPDGTLLGVAGTRGEGPGELIQPVFVAIGPDGAMYVTENELGRVQRFADFSLTLPVASPEAAG